MKNLTIYLIILIPFISHSICVHEKYAYGYELQSKSLDNVYIQNPDGSFEKPTQIKGMQKYLVQESNSSTDKGYDDKYIKYYHYSRIQEFLKTNNQLFKNNGYKVEVIGKSLKGKNLYKLSPVKMDPTKKLILMYGRHHGNEGTANWIIEGFLEKLFQSAEFKERFQLVLYPMVNPDGADDKKRYNSNGRDLNREWASASRNTKDEIKTISNDLFTKYLNKNIKPIIALDMHGSFTEDFIYRVSKNFSGKEFHSLQQEFIDELGSRDPFQKSNFQTSDGHPNMARIVLVRDFKINALTHETPRDIPLSSSRTLNDLKDQGVSVLNSLIELY